jgi:hypothetical protein
MTKAKALVLFVVAAHWITAIWHLFLAANVLPAPNNHVSSLAVILITSGHMIVSILVWMLGDEVAGAVAVLFFLAAMTADLYEHFLHASQNNVFMVAPGDWTAIFNASVFILLALEIVGFLLGTIVLSGGVRKSKSTSGPDAKFGREGPKLFSAHYTRPPSTNNSPSGI